VGDEGENIRPLEKSPSGEFGRLDGGEKIAGGERERDMALVMLDRSGEIGRILPRSLPDTSAADTIGTS
jgi:hypothetical protein